MKINEHEWTSIKNQWTINDNFMKIDEKAMNNQWQINEKPMTMQWKSM